MVEMLPAVERPAIEETWTTTQRAAFRFAFAYLTLFLVGHFNGFLEDMPGGARLAAGYAKLTHTAVPWVGAHVLRLDTPITVFTNGSGDTTFDWVQALCMLGVAAIAALAWGIADRSRRSYDTLHQWLRVAVRYSLALSMLSYGMVKVIKLQFPFPYPDRLLERFGDASPMGLLWTLMGYSRPYNVVTGAVEVAGGLLLFWKRTTPLGALLVAIGMVNVVALNFSYDVPVKLYSMHLLLLALFLLLPEMKRLAGVLILNRATEPVPLRPPVKSLALHRVGMGIKAIIVVAILGQTVTTALMADASRGDRSPTPPLYGIYAVESFTRDGQAIPPLLTDSTRWRRVTYSRSNIVSIHMANDAIARFSGKDDPAAKTLELSALGTYRFTYTYADATHLTLSGVYMDAPVEVSLRKVPLTSFLLVGRGFHWINEFPFNR